MKWVPLNSRRHFDSNGSVRGFDTAQIIGRMAAREHPDMLPEPILLLVEHWYNLFESKPLFGPWSPNKDKDDVTVPVSKRGTRMGWGEYLDEILIPAFEALR